MDLAPDAHLSNTEAARPSVDTRRSGLDAARLFAALGTVWTHAGANADFDTSSALGRFAVPFFSIVAGIYLVHALRGMPAADVPAYLQKRAHKLYLPFICWTLIFMALRYAASMVVAVHDVPTIAWWLPLTGSMYHLWFLPFLLIATLLLTPLIRLGLRNRVLSLVLAAVMIVGGILLVAFPAHVKFTGVCDQHYFLDRVWARSPALLWGVALALLIPRDPKTWRIHPVAAALGFCVTAACLGYYWSHGRTSWAANLAGVGWLLVGFGLDGTRFARVLAPLGRLSFGIYLIHPLIVAVYYKLAALKGIKEGPLVVMGAFVVAALISIAAMRVIRSTPKLSWLIP